MSYKVTKSVEIWLWSISLMVLGMVAIGGITRLTGSGLSMVDWKPIMGAIPPMNEGEWLKVFEDYQRYPEYQKVNMGMTLEEFKKIFFWEYLHRLWGRLVGFVVLLPYIYFLIKKNISGQFSLRIFIAFLLGASQGVLGWIMVKSGLVEDPHVSHFRLAAHLLLAFFLFAYVNWLIWDIRFGGEKSFKREPKLLGWTIGFASLITLQIIYGAFTAGKKAGFFLNTFPKMGDQWIADGVWDNVFQSPITIQFIHRSLGWSILFGVVFLWFLFRKRIITLRQRRGISVLVGCVFVQFLLGVFTLVMKVPISVATLHQVMGCILFGVSIHLIHSLTPKKII